MNAPASSQRTPGLAAVAAAFFLRDLREDLSYRVTFLLNLGAALLTLSTLFFFSRFIGVGRLPSLAPYGGDYLSFGLLGMVLLSLQHTAVSAYPTRVRAAQLAGTLEAMLATPTPSWMVLLCSPVYRFARALLGAFVQCALAWAIFDVRFSGASITTLLAGVPLTLLAFSSLGFFAATFTMLLRKSDPLGLFLGGLSTLAGGVLYPQSALPKTLRLLGQLLPITHALELLRRASFGGASLTELVRPLLTLSVFAFLLAPLGLLAFIAAVRRARRDGSLSHY